MSPSRSRWNIKGIQSRVGLLVVLGVLTSMLLPGWIASKSLAALADEILSRRLSEATSATGHLVAVVDREWSKLQEVATGPGIAAHHDDAASQALVLSALRTSYLRAELMRDTYVTDAEGRVRLREPHAGPADPAVLPGAGEALRSGRPTRHRPRERPERPRRLPLRAVPRLDGPGGWPCRRRDRSARTPFRGGPRRAQRPVERRFDRRHRQCGRHPRQHGSGPPGRGERPSPAPRQPHPDRRLDPRHVPQLSRGVGAPHHRPDGVRLGQVARLGRAGPRAGIVGPRGHDPAAHDAAGARPGAARPRAAVRVRGGPEPAASARAS